MLNADLERFCPFESSTNAQVLLSDLSEDQRYAAEKNGVKVYEDVQFYLVCPLENPFSEQGVEMENWNSAVA